MGFDLLHDPSCIDHGFNTRAPKTQAIYCLLFLYGWSLFKDTGTADLMLTLAISASFLPQLPDEFLISLKMS